MGRPDGNYTFEEIAKDLENSFTSEKDMCDFIERNIENFGTYRGL